MKRALVASVEGFIPRVSKSQRRAKKTNKVISYDSLFSNKEHDPFEITEEVYRKESILHTKRINRVISYDSFFSSKRDLEL